MIRKFAPKDRDIVINFCLDFYSGEGVSHSISKDNINKTFDIVVSGSSPYCDGYVYEDEDGSLLGYTILAFTYSNETGGKVVWIEELYVSPDARGKMVGSKILDFVFKNFSDCSRFRLEITESNKGALKLYKRKGFKELAYNQLEIIN